MSNIPSFKVNSKPELSAKEFEAEKQDTGSKFLQDPGTYSMIIKSFTFGDVNPFDSAWINATAVLQDPEGRDLKFFIDVPTECRNSFLFGDKKSTFNLEKLQTIFRGLGIAFDFDNAMQQVGALFGNPERLIGKPLNVRLGYKGPHVKYVSKTEYLVVEKDHTTLKIEGSFADKKSALAAAAEAGIKGVDKNGFMNVLEVFPSKETVIDLDVTESDTSELPF